MALQAIVTVVLAHTPALCSNRLRSRVRTMEPCYLNYHVTIEGAGGLFARRVTLGGSCSFTSTCIFTWQFLCYRNPPGACSQMLVLSTQSTTGMLICSILLASRAFKRQRHSPQGSRDSGGDCVPPILSAISNINNKLFSIRGSSWADNTIFTLD